jgi:5-formyltetrahydrofolate cyclo-ligase
LGKSKQDIRRIMRERRRALTPPEQQRHSLALAARVAGRHWFRSAQSVALYLSVDGEIDLAPLMRLCWRHGKSVHLPRIDADGNMRFALHRAADRLVRNNFGILQPRPGARVSAPGDLDAVFVPIVAYTREGQRLGMGGGYYDRAFSGPRCGNLVGVAHSCQCTDSLPTDPWDVAMALVMTEKGAVRPS